MISFNIDNNFNIMINISHHYIIRPISSNFDYPHNNDYIALDEMLGDTQCDVIGQ